MSKMTVNSAHIVICDDEPDLREMVGEYLEKRGYQVTLAENGADLLEKLDGEIGNSVDVVLLDINMPGDDGLTILRRIRAEREVFVIMLTAASDVVDKIVGLEMGADDYIGKPVDLREVGARVKAVLRRSEHGGTGDVQEKEREIIRFADMQLDLTAAKLFDSDMQEIPLTAMEFQLLKVFAKARGRVLNRDQLLELANDRDWDPFDRSIDIRISRLRRKIEINPSKPAIIRTVRGIGYTFDP